jgi:5-methylcytosine-specific restriction endonuclease McrA
VYKDAEQRRAYQRVYYRAAEQLARRARVCAAWRRRRRERIFRRDGFRCHYCGAVFAPADLTIDHRLARALGGTDADWNRLTSCADCNREKGALPYEFFLAMKRPDYAPAWVTE